MKVRDGVGSQRQDPREGPESVYMDATDYSKIK